MGPDPDPEGTKGSPWALGFVNTQEAELVPVGGLAATPGTLRPRLQKHRANEYRLSTLLGLSPVPSPWNQSNQLRISIHFGTHGGKTGKETNQEVSSSDTGTSSASTPLRPAHAHT